MAINISKTKHMFVTSEATHRQLSNTHSLPSVPFHVWMINLISVI